MIRSRTLITVALAVFLIAGCVRVYKLDIQQGNDLTIEQLDALQPGLSQQEVRQILGTPLIEDPFRNNRWDYFYAFKGGESKEIERRKLTLFFEDGGLAQIDGGLEPEMVESSEIDIDALENQGLTRKERRALRKQQKANKPSFMDRLRAVARRMDGEE